MLRQADGCSRYEVVDSPRYLQRYAPDHPHADPETGMVTESDIDPVTGIDTDLMMAGA